MVCCPSADKARWAAARAVLVDDRADNGAAWAAAGGVFVHHVGLEGTLRALAVLGVVDPVEIPALLDIK